MFRKLCGYAALKSVVLVTTTRGEVPHDISQAREEELSGGIFRLVLGEGAQMVRHHNTVQSAHDIIRRIVWNYSVVLRIQRELVDERRDLSNTSAGEALIWELNEEMRRDRAELEGIRAEIKRALRKKDERKRRKLEDEGRWVREQMEEAAMCSEAMISDHAAGKERIELARSEEKRRKAEKRAEAGRRRQPAGRTRSHQDETDDDDPTYG